jgi:hypothetical protein
MDRLRGARERRNRDRDLVEGAPPDPIEGKPQELPATGAQEQASQGPGQPMHSGLSRFPDHGGSGGAPVAPRVHVGRGVPGLKPPGGSRGSARPDSCYSLAIFSPPDTQPRRRDDAGVGPGSPAAGPTGSSLVAADDALTPEPARPARRGECLVQVALPRDAQQDAPPGHDGDAPEAVVVQEFSQAVQVGIVAHRHRIADHDLLDRPARGHQQQVAQTQHARKPPPGGDDAGVLHVVTGVLLGTAVQVTGDVTHDRPLGAGQTLRDHDSQRAELLGVALPGDAIHLLPRALHGFVGHDSTSSGSRDPRSPSAGPRSPPRRLRPGPRGARPAPRPGRS